jgi:rod shape determining protein RodA
MYRYRYLDNINWRLVITTLALTIIGIVFIYSSTHASQTLRYGVSPNAYLTKQLKFVLLGIVVAIITAMLDYRDFERFAWLIYVLALLLLIAVPILGTEINGAKRWIFIGAFSIQPAEFAKLAVIIALAKFFSGKEPPFSFWEILQALIIVLVPAFLVSRQPDLGTAMIFAILAFGFFFLAGLDLKYLIGATIAGLIVAPLAYIFVLKDYQKKRIKVYLNPEFDPYGAGYNVRQSKIAIGSGKLWGKGLFNSTQSQLNWLPEHHTDYIFAVIGEEIGFIGAAFVIGLYFYLLWQGVKITLEARDRFGALLAGGITLMIFAHVLINIGGAIGLMPSTGLTLPFISYGVNNLLVNMIAIGLLLSISMRQKKLNFYGA